MGTATINGVQRAALDSIDALSTAVSQHSQTLPLHVPSFRPQIGVRGELRPE